MALNVTYITPDRDRRLVGGDAAGAPLPRRATAATVEEILLPGLPLGGLEEAEYSLRVKDFRAGDVLLLLSDGLPELVDPGGELLGYDAVGALSRRARRQERGGDPAMRSSTSAMAGRGARRRRTTSPWWWCGGFEASGDYQTRGPAANGPVRRNSDTAGGSSAALPRRGCATRPTAPRGATPRRCRLPDAPRAAEDHQQLPGVGRMADEAIGRPHARRSAAPAGWRSSCRGRGRWRWRGAPRR